ncbi:MAG: response regulator [Deltaproteobacteria bacterium]
MILQAPGQQRYTILVAEGDPRAREALRTTLGDDGHVVIVASTGGQALDMAPGSDADLVLLDLGGSETDGLATLRALRTLGQSAPVILLAAGATLQGAREAMGLGAYDFIAKPVEMGFVMSVIQEALERTPRAARVAVCAP